MPAATEEAPTCDPLFANVIVGVAAAALTVPVTTKSLAVVLALSKMYQAPEFDPLNSTHLNVTVDESGKFWSAEMAERSVLPIWPPPEVATVKLTVAISTNEPELILY